MTKKWNIRLRQIQRIVPIATICSSIMMAQAFALDEETQKNISSMFSALSSAYAWLKMICIIGACVAIASLSYSFFFAGGANAEKRIAAAKSSLVKIIIAFGILALLPTIIVFAKDAFSSTGWNPNETPDNHIVAPADSDGKLFTQS